MLSNQLPLPLSEARFWHEVAAKWARTPGLTVVVAPQDLNTAQIARVVRVYACEAPGSELDDDDTFVPDFRDTYCYEPDHHNGLATIDGGEFLPQVLCTTDQVEKAQTAAYGEQPFYLMVSGIALPPDMPVSRWIRQVAATWPVGVPGARGARFHCCCILTAPLPESNEPLPDGCYMLVPPIPHEGEIVPIVQMVVDAFWPGENEVIQHYLCSGIADMASSRRTHAEQALQVVRDVWISGRAHQPEWRPHWDDDPSRLWSVRETIRAAGLDEAWLQALMDGEIPEHSANEISMIRQLWSYGLWYGLVDHGFWSGLTALGRSALPLPDIREWVAPAAPTDAALQIFRHTVHVEHQLKHHLLRLMHAPRVRDAVDRVLDQVRPYETETNRAYIGRRMRDWDVRIAPPLRNNSDVLISVCEFGVLLTLLERVHRHPARGWMDDMKRVMHARNKAAHGGWFTMEEYRRVLQLVDRMEASIRGLTLPS